MTQLLEPSLLLISPQESDSETGYFRIQETPSFHIQDLRIWKKAFEWNLCMTALLVTYIACTVYVS